MPRTSWVCAAAFCFGLTGTARAEDEAPALKEIPVPEDQAAEPPPTPNLDWNIVGDVQGDGMVATSADDYDRLILRRARISGIADWKFDWRLRVSGDLGKFRGLRDLSVEYRGLPIYLAFGRMIEPFGLLQGGASSAAFMERPQPMMLAPGYGEGGSANYARETWQLTAGAFYSTQNDIDLGRRKENAYTARMTWAPLLTDTHVVHVGFAASRRKTGSGFQRFDAIPESALVSDLDTRSALFSEDPGGTSLYTLYGGEVAVQLKSLLLQSEYILLTFDDVATRGPGGLVPVTAPRFSGWYVEASWAVTGEQRDYSVRRGVFGNIYPQNLRKGHMGAVEVAARYSRTDLRFNLPYHGAVGDRGSIASVGLNWYPTDTLKAMLDGVQLERLGESKGVSTEVRQWLVQARLQWYFRWP